MLNSSYKRLRLILGDQLNARHSWFKQKSPDTLYVLIELKQELSYCHHHIQKACAFLEAMHQFSRALEQAEHHVMHLDLNKSSPLGALPDILLHLCNHYKIEQFEYQQPDEWRLQQQLKQAKQTVVSQCNTLNYFSSVSSEHFYLSSDQCQAYFKQGVSHRLGHFYKKMRKQFNILMQGDDPEGGKWDYDLQNRKKINPKQEIDIPDPLLFSSDVSAIIVRLKAHNIKVIGQEQPQLLWPCNRRQSLQLLSYFCQHLLPKFGHFQDAMLFAPALSAESKSWGLYHARLSFSLNSKMLSPHEVVASALDAYQKHPDVISLPQVEGFIRQILGWREFVRGMYWANMPELKTSNFLAADKKLPSWFWTGQTKMRCLQQSISQSLEFAYAHHIQRLMITGNFCLLAGVDPDAVDLWYMSIYIDAIEWVELPNARGMSQFADGGLIGSKAYAASGTYVNKMSNYCKHCHYQIKDISLDTICPLTVMYWHFLQQHADKLQSNPRHALTYKQWQKKTESDQMRILQQATYYLENIEQL